MLHKYFISVYPKTYIRNEFYCIFYKYNRLEIQPKITFKNNFQMNMSVKKKMDMSIDSVIAHTVNDILIGDLYLAVRNGKGQEQIQIYPTRLEKIYKHKMKRVYLLDEFLEFPDHNHVEEMYYDERISCETQVYCRFRINGKLTHAMHCTWLTLSSFVSLKNKMHTPATDTTDAIWKTTPATIHFMPYNIEVDAEEKEWSTKFSNSLCNFIERAFPDLPTTCVHEFEQMKLSKETLNGHKRKRDKVTGM
tara:strand:- start:101 stop:847 length:747 start_codon:yes stop_codon:yes gene_type:complete